MVKLAKKGMTPSAIGVILRDQHGISQVRSGFRIPSAFFEYLLLLRTAQLLLLMFARPYGFSGLSLPRCAPRRIFCI